MHEHCGYRNSQDYYAHQCCSSLSTVQNRVKRRRKLDWCSGSRHSRLGCCEAVGFQEEQCATDSERRCGTGKNEYSKRALKCRGK
jgi:hypothetical protein